MDMPLLPPLLNFNICCRCLRAKENNCHAFIVAGMHASRPRGETAELGLLGCYRNPSLSLCFLPEGARPRPPYVFSYACDAVVGIAQRHASWGECGPKDNGPANATQPI